MKNGAFSLTSVNVHKRRFEGLLVHILVKMADSPMWRGFGFVQDVKTDPGSTVFFTKQDYNKLSPGLKAAARFFRDPFVFFSLTASLFFWVIQPFPK